MGNQAQLQQQAGNLGAINQAFNMRQQGLGNNQNLLAALGQIAQGMGSTASQEQQAQDATGGLLGKTAGYAAGPVAAIGKVTGIF